MLLDYKIEKGNILLDYRVTIVALYHTIYIYSTFILYTHTCYTTYRTLDLIEYTNCVYRSVSCTTQNYKHCLPIVVTIAT